MLGRRRKPEETSFCYCPSQAKTPQHRVVPPLSAQLKAMLSVSRDNLARYVALNTSSDRTLGPHRPSFLLEPVFRGTTTSPQPQIRKRSGKPEKVKKARKRQFSHHQVTTTDSTPYEKVVVVVLAPHPQGLCPISFSVGATGGLQEMSCHYRRFAQWWAA